MKNYLYSILKIDFVAIKNKIDFHPESILRATVTSSLQDTLSVDSFPTFLVIYYLEPWIECLCRKPLCSEISTSQPDENGSVSVSIHKVMQCYGGSCAQSTPIAVTVYLDE